MSPRNVPRSRAKSPDAKALRLFHEVAALVPAYRSFLKKHGVDPRAVRTMSDFEQVPVTTKQNYILAYSVEERMREGDLTRASLIASSSGTTGAPLYWPRSMQEESDAVRYHEYLLRRVFKVNEKTPTLAVVGFPMGVYISGVATALPLYELSKRLPITIVTAGINKDGIVDMLERHIGRHARTILFGHPFFVKDVIESGRERIDWKRYDIRLMMCSEGFTEEWRSYVMEILGTRDPSRVVNTYGSSELLLIGSETAFSIKARRKMAGSGRGLAELFGDAKEPHNLFQYDPARRYTESRSGALLFTADMATPFIRYQIGDEGLLFSFDEIAAGTGIKPGAGDDRLPFVSLKGRLDHTITFHGINMYPEHFHHALNARKFLRAITGKFVLERVADKKGSPKLLVTVEARPGAMPARALVAAMRKAIDRTLRSESIEYRFLVAQIKGVHRPDVRIRPYQDPDYFKPGMKPKYIRA